MNLLWVLSDQCESVSALRSKGRALLASGHEQLPLSQGGGAGVRHQSNYFNRLYARFNSSPSPSPNNLTERTWTTII